jgi:Na+/pantothenate symporter
MMDEFWVGFTSFAFQMRFDVITVLFLVPLVFGLFLKSKENKYANSISILIAGTLFSAPLLTGLTDQTNQPYRFLPIIIFFAIGVGMLFSKITVKVTAKV